MSNRLIPTTIVDRYGRPAAFYDASRGIRYNRDRGPEYTHNLATDAETWIKTYDRQRLMSIGRYLYNNSPIVRGAVLEMGHYAFPLEPQFRGADQEFGRRAEEWLHEWHGIMSLHGQDQPFDTLCRFILRGVMTDGDIATLLTAHGSGMPAVQIIPSHRVTGDDERRRLALGVWRSANGRPVAYQLDGIDGRRVSSNSLFLTYLPDGPDTFRGVPRLVASIHSFQDIKRLREYEMRAHQMAASIGLIERNDLGMPEDFPADALSFSSGLPQDKTPTAPLTVQEFEEGVTRYFRANSGNGLEAFKWDRPGASALEFEQRIVAQALYGLGWDPNFALALETPSGAYARTIIEKVRRTVQEIQRMTARWARRIDGYGVSIAIRDGLLPAPSDGDWFSWEYQGPARITADSGNEAKLKQESYKLGLTTHQELSAETGKWWQEVRAQREIETDDLLTRASRIAQKWDLSLPAALALLEQRTPNPSTPEGNSEAISANPEDE